MLGLSGAKRKAILEIDRKDLENLMRHAYLLGTNTGDYLLKDHDGWENDREECIKDLVDDYEENGYMCYGSLCGKLCDNNEFLL